MASIFIRIRLVARQNLGHDARMTENTPITEPLPPQNPSPAEPVFNVPPVTMTLVAFLVGIYAVQFWILPNNTANTVMDYCAFIPLRLTMAGLHDWGAYGTLLSYMLLHGSLLHIALNGTMLLSLGSGIERVLGGGRFTAFFILCGICSILFQYGFDSHSSIPLIGASGAISGLFGAVIVLMQRMGRYKPGWKGILPVVIVWSVANIILGMMGMPGQGEGIAIAWLAHLGGFYAGIALFPLFLKRP